MSDRLALEFLPWPRANELTQMHPMVRAKEKAACMRAFDMAALAWHLRNVSGPAAVQAIIADRADIDARIKSLLDGLQHAGAFGDDRQVVDLHIRKVPPRLIGPAVLIRYGQAIPWGRSEVSQWWGDAVPPKQERTTR